MEERNKDGTIPQGVSGNKLGRPKGSRNKITLAKLMLEEAVRTENAEDMMDVCRLVIQEAKEGSFQHQRLVWDSLVTKATSSDQSTGKEKVHI